MHFKCNKLFLKMFSLVETGYRDEVVSTGAHFLQQTLSPHYFLSLPLPDISRFSLPGTLLLIDDSCQNNLVRQLDYEYFKFKISHLANPQLEAFSVSPMI